MLCALPIIRSRRILSVVVMKSVCLCLPSFRWQHIGDEEWKRQAVQNLKEMIVQYRNHPSIILWGVRINESQDDDVFYRETNRVAHELDDTRATGGVRMLKKSHLLEDVYTYNDFLHDAGDERILCQELPVHDTVL